MISSCGMLAGLATSYRSVRRAVANLRQAVEVFDGLLQTCDRLSKCSMGCCKPATSYRSVRRAVVNLRQAVEVFDGLLQTCDKLSKCSTSCCKPATGCRSVRWAVTNLQQAVEVFDELLQTCDKPSKCSTEHCKDAIHTDKKTSARIGTRNREALWPRRTFSEGRKRP